jgi:hypothetical protein
MTVHSIVVENGMVAVEVATGFGPRVVGLRPAGGDNLFAELGELGIDLGEGRRFSFHGGHRLWLAPEVPEVTYEPDDSPVETATGSGYVTVTGVIAGVEKTIRVQIVDGEPEVVVDHLVTNRGTGPIEAGPWAITQLRTEGVALLPLGTMNRDPRGLRPSTAVVGWPYTDWGGLEWDPASRVMHISGARQTPTKIGTSLARGWLAYALDGWIFAKYARPGRLPIDLGADAQVYANADFVELETLGAFVSLEPGESMSHREVWRVWAGSRDLSEAARIVDSWRPRGW